MTSYAISRDRVESHFQDKISAYFTEKDELTVEVTAENLREVCFSLRDEPSFKFDMLMDICGVDYLAYGVDEWRKEETTTTGFSRGVIPCNLKKSTWTKPRFAVVYHLLSIGFNHRI